MKMSEHITPDVQNIIDPVTEKLKRQEFESDKEVALEISHLLMRVISTRWSSPHELISLVRAVGFYLCNAQSRYIIPGNIVRRVLSLIRDEIDPDHSSNGNDMMSSMFSLLTTNKTPNTDIKTILKKESSDLRSIVIQTIRDLIDEISNANEVFEAMSVDLIHDNEVLLTPTPNSDTVLQFLIKASAKRKFTVLVTENYPNEVRQAHKFVKTLAEKNIEAVLIPDSIIFAVMSRVGKVIIGPNSVFANGGCLSTSGVASVAECAKEHKTPVFAIAGLYRLSPLYPFDRDDLIEVGNSSKVLNYDDFRLLDNVSIVTNPLADYIPPEHVDLYITNIGGFAPSFLYRIVLDTYRTEDNNLE